MTPTPDRIFPGEELLNDVPCFKHPKNRAWVKRGDRYVCYSCWDELMANPQKLARGQ